MNFTIGMPQVVMIVILFLSLLLHIVKHGESREAEKYNAVTQALEMIIVLSVLYWGGFFDA